MTDIKQLTQQNQRMFILVCLNFIMLLILFLGLGFVIWQSVSLISKVKKDLVITEQAVVQLQKKIQHMDMNALMDRIVDRVKENMGESVKAAISQTEFGVSLNSLAKGVENTQNKLGDISESLKTTNDRLQKINTEQLARLVSYNILKGLGNGFTSAAEDSKP